MKKYIPAFLLILMTTITCGYSFHSYQTAITEIEIPHYRKPDSLTIINENQSVASLLWKEYYQDENLKALIDTALQRNLSYIVHFCKWKKQTAIYRKRPIASGLLSTSVCTKTKSDVTNPNMPSINTALDFH